MQRNVPRFCRITWQRLFFLLLSVEVIALLISAEQSPWVMAIVLGLLVGISILVLVDNSVAYMFLLVLPLLPILSQTAHTVTLWVLFLLTIGYWYLKWISKSFAYEGLPRYVRYFFYIFLSISALSTLNSLIRRVCILELVRYLSMYVILVVFFELVKTKHQLRRIMNIVVISSAIMVLLSIPEILSSGAQGAFSGGLIQKRLGSFYGNPNNFAIPFLFSIPVIFCKLIHLDHGKKHKLINMLTLILLLLIFVYVVFLTSSRSALLSLGISMSVLLVTFKTGRRVLLAVMLLFIAVLPKIYEVIYFALRLGIGFTGREHVWKAAVEMVRNNVLLGVGPGMFESTKAYYILPVDFLSRLTRSLKISGAAHNLYLTVASELGIFAAILLVGFLILLIQRVVSLVRKTNDIELRKILYIAVSVLSGLIIRSFFESGVIIGSGRLGDGIYFLLIILFIARAERLVVGA